MRIVSLIPFAPLTLPTRRGGWSRMPTFNIWAGDKIQLKDETLEDNANLPDP
jgi:hypothetical protein